MTWREAITKTMTTSRRWWCDDAPPPPGDTWADVESCTLSDAELDEDFDDSFGCTNGKEFTLWTRNFVYFPVCYDGAEWCGVVPRHPNGVATEHQGGG